MVTTLTISAAALHDIEQLVRLADDNECMGLLGAHPGEEAVTKIELLRSRATASSAEASPLALKQAADAMAAHSIVPRGIWHSHGAHGVFHSSTDVATIHRLLPAMAMHCFRRDVMTMAPTVEASDAAVLPLADGRLMRVTILPEPVHGTDLAAPLAWTSVSATFARSLAQPVVQIHTAQVRLVGPDVTLVLGLPPGATIEQRIVDRSTMRYAKLFSLVVNARRERYAQCLEVTEVSGEIATRLVDCAVEVIDNEARDAGERGELRGVSRHEHQFARA